MGMSNDRDTVMIISEGGVYASPFYMPGRAEKRTGAQAGRYDISDGPFAMNFYGVGLITTIDYFSSNRLSSLRISLPAELRGS